jgi:hypothetical protein
MPVTLVTPIVAIVPAFDKVHLENLTISSEQTTYAKVTLVARIRPYLIDANGDKIFSTEFKDITVLDAEKWAIDAAVTGDMRGVQATSNIKTLMALLVETHTPYGATVVS